jgi:hypothetical protein
MLATIHACLLIQSHQVGTAAYSSNNNSATGQVHGLLPSPLDIATATAAGASGGGSPLGVGQGGIAEVCTDTDDMTTKCNALGCYSHHTASSQCVARELSVTETSSART